MPRVIACSTAKPRMAKAMSRLAANTPREHADEIGQEGAGDARPRAATRCGGRQRQHREVGPWPRQPAGNFDARAASQRLSTLMIVVNTAAAGRHRHDQQVDHALESRSDALVDLAAALGAAGVSWSVPKLGMAATTTSVPISGGPQHQPADRIPFERAAAAIGGRAAPAATDSRATMRRTRCTSTR